MSIADLPLPIFEPPEPWRLSVEQYHAMAKQGILADDDRVELLEGLLVAKMTVSPAHHRTTHRVQDALRKRVPEGHYVASPSSVTLLTSEPEPDVIVVRGSNDDYADRHPGPADVVLVVEVSDTSLRSDQGFKKMIYAKSSLPVYWIVNLIDRRVEVYSDPTGPAERPDYRHHDDFSEAESVPLGIEGREVGQIPVRSVL